MIHALQLTLLFVFPALVLVGAAVDVASFRIPNWVSLALLAAFPLAALAGGLPWSVVSFHLAVGAAALAVGVLLFMLRWIGGGDAKLFAAGALWLGWPATLTFIVDLCFAGGGLAILLLVLRSARVRPLAEQGPAWVARLADPRRGVPYGAAIAVGALAAFPASPLARALGAPF